MLKLKSIITEQEFKAKSKETGRVVVYKSKDSMDKAIKGGTAEPLDKKTSDKSDSGKPEKVKGQDLFKKDKPVDSKPKTPTFVNDDGDVVANDFDSALELAGNLGMSEEELEYIEKEKDSEALGDYLDGHGYSQKDKPEEKESEWSEEDEEGYITNLKTGEREYVRENKMKLKSLLKETKVWERKFGEPLPTFSGVMEKHSGKKIDEQGALSRRAGINVFGDRKLQLMTKNLRQTAFDLEKVAKKKDEQAFDDILQRITITIGVMRSFLNKPKRSM
tara:strand:+ start:2285 stop:3112 length:828 start_codon:yes stop_codon:yes gene_type:complete